MNILLDIAVCLAGFGTGLYIGRKWEPWLWAWRDWRYWRRYPKAKNLDVVEFLERTSESLGTAYAQDHAQSVERMKTMFGEGKVE